MSNNFFTTLTSLFIKLIYKTKVNQKCRYFLKLHLNLCEEKLIKLKENANLHTTGYSEKEYIWLFFYIYEMNIILLKF